MFQVTVSFYHLCASMRACVLVFLAFYSYLTPGAVARSVACKFRKQVLRLILAPGYSSVGSNC